MAREQRCVRANACRPCTGAMRLARKGPAPPRPAPHAAYAAGHRGRSTAELGAATAHGTPNSQLLLLQASNGLSYLYKSALWRRSRTHAAVWQAQGAGPVMGDERRHSVPASRSKGSTQLAVASCAWRGGQQPFSRATHSFSEVSDGALRPQRRPTRPHASLFGLSVVWNCQQQQAHGPGRWLTANPAPPHRRARF